jgi:hypothetical protein
MSPLIVRYPTWEELYGARPSKTDLLQLVSSLERFQSVVVLSQINLVLALDRLHSNKQDTYDLQTFLVNLLIDDELFARLKDKFGREELVNLRPFHSLQVLTLMKRIMLEGSKTGGLRPGEDAQANACLGRCLIMVNDFLCREENVVAISPKRSENERRIALQLQVGSGLEINNPPPIYTSVVRSDMIFGEPAADMPGLLKVRASFQQSTGMTLEDYVDHVLGLLTYYITLDSRKLFADPGPSYIATERIFAESPKEIVEKFWARELVTIDQLEATLREPTGLIPHLDFIGLRRKPFLETAAGSAVPLHLGFVQEKLEAGLFWAIFNCLSATEERDFLFTIWGHLFERYVSRTLTKCFASSQTQFSPFSQFSDNGEEAFDGLVRDGDSLIVMEYKGGFLNASAKYADDEAAFLRDLNRKFGGDKGAGIAQLVRKIGAAFAEDVRRRRPIEGIDTLNTKLVIPVLVVQDSFISSEMTASFLADIFAAMMQKLKLDPSVGCTALVVLDISDVELFKPYVTKGTVSLVDCLIAFVRLRGDKLLPFRDFFQLYRQDRNIAVVVDDETLERFTQIMNRISQRFFKKPLGALN